MEALRSGSVLDRRVDSAVDMQFFFSYGAVEYYLSDAHYILKFLVLRFGDMTLSDMSQNEKFKVLLTAVPIYLQNIVPRFKHPITVRIFADVDVRLGV